MKTFEYKDLVKFPKKPLEIYEVAAIREYDVDQGHNQPIKKIKVLLLWGINTNMPYTATEDQVVSASAYWEDGDLPFKDITVENQIKKKSKTETKEKGEEK